MPASSYWSDTRAPRHSLLLALPLLLLYEVLAAALAGQAGFRNGADVLLNTLIVSAVGRGGTIYVTGAVILLCIAWIVRDAQRHGGIRARWIPLMLLESAVLAIVFAIVVSVATMQLLTGLGATLMTAAAAQGGAVPMDTATALMLSLGAGLYEELLFRVLLVTAIAAGVRAVAGASPLAAGVVASVASALLFSAFHYVGAYGDAFTIESFTFRAVAGLAFSALYLLRGFGITAWTHALYDVGVLLL